MERGRSRLGSSQLESIPSSNSIGRRGSTTRRESNLRKESSAQDVDRTCPHTTVEVLEAGAQALSTPTRQRNPWVCMEDGCNARDETFFCMTCHSEYFQLISAIEINRFDSLKFDFFLSVSGPIRQSIQKGSVCDQSSPLTNERPWPYVFRPFPMW